MKICLSQPAHDPYSFPLTILVDCFSDFCKAPLCLPHDLKTAYIIQRLCKRKITFLRFFFPLPFCNSFHLDSTAVCIPECDLPVSAKVQLLLLYLVLEINLECKVYHVFYIFWESNFPRYITGVWPHTNLLFKLFCHFLMFCIIQWSMLMSFVFHV